MPQHQTVDLNTSGLDDLATLPGVDETKARALTEARPFSGWSDLKRADFDAEEIETLKAAGARLGESGEGPIGEPGSGGSGGSPEGNLGRA